MATIDSSTGQIVTPPTPTIAPVPLPTAESVYSAANITQAATNPALPVNPALDEYNSFLNTPDIIAARNGVSSLQMAINSERAGLRNTTTGLEYQNDNALGTTGASMNLIGRQVGRANQLSSNRQAALGDQFSAATAYLQGLENIRKEQFQVYTQEKQRIQSLIAQTGNQAGISPTDTFEVATEKAFKWQQDQEKKAEKKAKEEQKKADKKAQEKADEASKKELKNLISKLGGSTKTKKGGTLDLKGLEKEYERLSGESYKKEQSRSDKEFAMKVESHNKAMTEVGGGKDTPEDIFNQGTQGISQYFDSVSGSDGKVSPSDWAEAKAQWAKNKLPMESFNAIFGKYQNPQETYN